MALQDEKELKLVATAYEEQKELIAHNTKLYNIFEGDLHPYVIDALKAELSQKSFEQVVHRIAPINVLRRLIDKLSKIYAKPPLRKIGENQQDKDLLDFYTKNYDLNTNGSLANESFNLYKTAFLEPYLHEEKGLPCLRVIPSNRAFVLSTNEYDPMRMTHWVKIMGQRVVKGEKRAIFYVYTDNEFQIIDEKAEIQGDLMAALNNPGINVYNKIPSVYINRSRNDLVPKKDSDTLAMTILIPVLLSDLNYAVKFQCFSILYGINVDEEGLKIAPNAFWRFKSDKANPEAKPEVGMLKPEVDTDKVIDLIKAELSMWMQSRNIKPGAMGTMTVENAASAIAKVVDEMDTSEDRQKQVPYFQAAEKELFDLTINHLHPVWMRNPIYQEKRAFSPGAQVSIEFAEQKPMVDQSKLIDDEVKKLDKGLQDELSAMKTIYPDLSDEQIAEKMKLIKGEQEIRKAEKAKEMEAQMKASGARPFVN